MVLFTRTFDLLAWLLPKSTGFPKVYRMTLTPRLMSAALDFAEHAHAAYAHRGRRREQALGDADAALGRLRLYLRLAFRFRWLNEGQYLHVSRMVAEIGRLLGGWRKKERGRP